MYFGVMLPGGTQPALIASAPALPRPGDSFWIDGAEYTVQRVSFASQSPPDGNNVRPYDIWIWL